MTEVNASEEASLMLAVDEYSYLDGEEGFVVRKGTQVGHEKGGVLIYTYELESEAAAQVKLKALVSEHALAGEK